jgi:hypothetical protein
MIKEIRDALRPNSFWDDYPVDVTSDDGRVEDDDGDETERAHYNHKGGDHDDDDDDDDNDDDLFQYDAEMYVDR